MKAAPAGLYDGVLVLGGKSEATSPPTANIGGIFGTPSYALSYLLAARMLLERAVETGRVNDVALPLAYLQRHAFELGLKTLIDVAYDVAADEERIDLVKRGEAVDTVRSKRAPRIHPLPRLINDLRQALATIGYAPVPSELVELADVLSAVEEHEPTRLRYERVGRGDHPPMPSLPESRPFEVGSMQKRLEEVFVRFMAYRENAMHLDSEQWNLLEALAMEQEANFQQLLRLGVEP